MIIGIVEKAGVPQNVVERFASGDSTASVDAEALIAAESPIVVDKPVAVPSESSDMRVDGAISSVGEGVATGVPAF